MKNERGSDIPDLTSKLSNGVNRPTPGALAFTIRLLDNLKEQESKQKNHMKVLRDTLFETRRSQTTQFYNQRQSRFKISKNNTFEIDKELKRYMQKQ